MGRQIFPFPPNCRHEKNCNPFSDRFLGVQNFLKIVRLGGKRGQVTKISSILKNFLRQRLDIWIFSHVCPTAKSYIP